MSNAYGTPSMPTNHTITLPDGKFARARVVYLQPKAERRREQSATVHIGVPIAGGQKTTFRVWG